MRIRLLLAGAAALALLTPATGSAAILPAPLAAPAASVAVAWPCPPGYHLGRGGQRCWPNGWAPAEEIPPGFVPGPRVYPPPPVLECPPGYHLGRGLQRCWPN